MNESLLEIPPNSNIFVLAKLKSIIKHRSAKIFVDEEIENRVGLLKN